MWSAVDKLSELTYTSVHESLMHIISLCLDNNPSLLPQSCKATEESREDVPQMPTLEDVRDPVDFQFWSEQQAKRILLAIEQAFSIELMPAVVLADANVGALMNRILVSKELLSE